MSYYKHYDPYSDTYSILSPDGSLWFSPSTISIMKTQAKIEIVDKVEITQELYNYIIKEYELFRQTEEELKKIKEHNEKVQLSIINYLIDDGTICLDIASVVELTCLNREVKRIEDNLLHNKHAIIAQIITTVFPPVIPSNLKSFSMDDFNFIGKELN